MTITQPRADAMERQYQALQAENERLLADCAALRTCVIELNDALANTVDREQFDAVVAVRNLLATCLAERTGVSRDLWIVGAERHLQEKAERS